MDGGKRLRYRSVQIAMGLGCRFLSWRRPKLLQGPGCTAVIRKIKTMA